MRRACALLVLLLACKNEQAKQAPPPAPTPVATDAAPPVKPAVQTSVVIFEGAEKHVGPGYEPASYQRALVPVMCWNGDTASFGVGAACLDLAPEGAEVVNGDRKVVLAGRATTAFYRGMESRAIQPTDNINGQWVWPADAVDRVFGVGSPPLEPDRSPGEGISDQEEGAIKKALGLGAGDEVDAQTVELDGATGKGRLVEVRAGHDRDGEDNLNAIGMSGLYLALNAEVYVPLMTSQTEVVWPELIDLDRNGRDELIIRLESEKGEPEQRVLARVVDGKLVEVGRFAADRL